MRLHARVDRVERLVGRPHELTWAEVEPAWQRRQARLLAKLTALAADTPLPGADPDGERDRRLLDLWDRQQGVLSDPGARERLMEKVERLDEPVEA